MQAGARFLDKNSPRLLAEVRSFLKESLGFGDFIFHMPDYKEVDRAADVRRGSPVVARVSAAVPDVSVLSCDPAGGVGTPGDSADVVNMLGRGLAMADRVTAVSPTFAWEITTPEGAFGLHDVLAGRQEPVAGIVNGIDTDAFNPANDRNIVRRFGIRSLDARSENRLALATHFGLHVDDSTPIVGIVSRLVDQKGLDILAAAVPGLLDRGARLAVIGSGDVGLEQTFWNLAIAHPGAVGVFIGYDARLAQRVYAGCDVFAMPSRFEPCGIGQLIAMRYGAVPLVRRTGGLADTVTPRTGFLFDDPTPAALEAAFDDLLTVFADRDRWRRMQRAGMRLDSSWASSAQEYARIFETLRG